jgi:hypothetical protein
VTLVGQYFGRLEKLTLAGINRQAGKEEDESFGIDINHGQAVITCNSSRGLIHGLVHLHLLEQGGRI